jgi:beta-N-acetylhexosaminidase
VTLDRLLIAFAGTELPRTAARRIGEGGAVGLTLFRAHNVVDPPQVRRLTAAIQRARPAGAPPVLVAADQEGGQLVGLGDGTTQFAGAMALGATGDEDLAERVAGATARELRALGVTVDYAPVCDLADNPANPVLGIRSFGDEPGMVGRLAAATVRGLQAGGVAATVKHFPGGGDATADPHDEMPQVHRTTAELAERELVPFRAALEAGARLVMSGHFALSGRGAGLPASLSAAVLRDLLRGQLRFDGVTVTDALDMGALAQGSAQIVDAIAALRAGEDALLGTADDAALDRLAEGLDQARRRGLVDADDDAAARRRLGELRRWLARFDQPPLDVVGCGEHEALAAELARRSITLVRNDDGLLPVRPAAGGRIAVVQSTPADLTPADTSSTVRPTLAAALRRRLGGVEEILLPASPEATLGDLGERLAPFDLVVVGTFAAHLQPAQADLAATVLAAGRPAVTVALRTPWDLLGYPSARTHVCSYGILPPSMEALAAALLGEAPFAGRLPVAIPGLYPRGHGLTAGG